MNKLFFSRKLNDPNLPPLDIQNPQWIIVLPIGEHTLPDGEKFNVTPEMLKTIEENTNLALLNFQTYASGQEPYTFPVLREHQFNGERDGDILQVKVSDWRGMPTLWLKVHWVKETFDKIIQGKIKNVSVRIDNSYTDATGVQYGLIVREVSLTGSPVLDNIGTIQDTLDVKLSKEKSKGDKMPKLSEHEDKEKEVELADEEVSEPSMSHEDVVKLMYELMKRIEQLEGLALAEELEEEEGLDLSEELEEAKMSEEDKEELLEELSRKLLPKMIENIRLSKMNTSPKNIPQKKSTSAPSTVDGVIALARSKNLSGKEFLSFVETECKKLNISK